MKNSFQWHARIPASRAIPESQIRKRCLISLVQVKSEHQKSADFLCKWSNVTWKRIYGSLQASAFKECRALFHSFPAGLHVQVHCRGAAVSMHMHICVCLLEVAKQWSCSWKIYSTTPPLQLFGPINWNSKRISQELHCGIAKLPQWTQHAHTFSRLFLMLASLIFHMRSRP